MKRQLSMVLAVPLMVGAFAAHAGSGVEPVQPATADYHLIKSGDLETAERILQYAHESRENDPVKMLNLAYVLQKKGQSDQAATIYREVLQLDSNPYAMTATGEPRRVKSIARLGLERLGYAPH